MYINSRYGMIANSFGMPETQTCYHKNRVQTLKPTHKLWATQRTARSFFRKQTGAFRGATPLAHWGVFSMSVSGA